MAGEIQGLHVNFAEIAADTTEEWYAAIPWPGTWKLVKAYLTSMTARTAHATNYVTVTLKKSTTSIAAFSTDTATTDDLVAGTPVELAITGTGTDLEFAQGTAIGIHKTDPGTGLALDGSVDMCFEQVR